MVCSFQGAVLISWRTTRFQAAVSSGLASPMPESEAERRCRCSCRRNGWREYTGMISYTPSPYRKPRSSGEMRASASGRKAPFSQTGSATWGEFIGSVEPQADGVDGAADDAGLGHGRLGADREVAIRLAVDADTQDADALAAAE